MSPRRLTLRLAALITIFLAAYTSRPNTLFGAVGCPEGCAAHNTTLCAEMCPPPSGLEGECFDWLNSQNPDCERTGCSASASCVYPAPAPPCEEQARMTCTFID